MSRALRADGLSTFIGGVLNSFPYTCFAENVGLVRLTRVKSRYVVAAAGVFMILIGLIPKAGALVASVPPPVLGGAALAMFATVAVVGIQTLARVDFHDHRNVVIVGTSLGLAMFVTAQPDVAKAVPDWAQIIFGSGITLGSLCAILLNLVFHHIGKNFGPAVAGTPGAGVIRLDQVNEMDREEFVRHLRPAVPGPELGRRTGLRPAAVHRHPRPADLVPGGAVLRRPERAARPASASTRTWAATPSRATPAARSRHVTRASVGLTLLNDEDHEEFAHLTQAYRDRFGIPADRLRAGRGEARPDPEVRLGAHAELADPGARRGGHRGRQDRQPPVRRPGRRRQPVLCARAANLEAASTRCPRRPTRVGVATGQTDGLRRFNAMSDEEARATLAILPGRPALDRGRRRAGAPTHSAQPPCCTGPGPSASSFTDAEIGRRPGPAPQDRRAGRRRPRRRVLRTGAGRRRGRRPGRDGGDPGRERRVRKPVRPGVPDPGGRPAGRPRSWPNCAAG